MGIEVVSALASLLVIGTAGKSIWKVASQAAQAREARRHWGRLVARKLGDDATIDDRTHWLGGQISVQQERGGRTVLLTLRPGRGTADHPLTLVQVTLGPGEAPDGLAIQPWFRGRDRSKLSLMCSLNASDPAQLERLLSDTHLTRRLEHHASQRRLHKITDTKVILGESRMLTDTVDTLLKATIDLAEALAAAWLRPWTDLADQHDLVESTSSLGERSLLGRAEGFHVRLQLRHSHSRISVLIIRIAHDAPLPAGLRVSAREGEDPSDGLHLGDPILDRLVLIRGNDPDEIRSRLADPQSPTEGGGLHGDLLEVVHGYPGSALEPTEIVIRLDSTVLTRLPAAFEAGIALARRLRESGHSSSGIKAPGHQPSGPDSGP